MPKRPGGVVLEAITIDHDAPIAIHMQVYDGIRALVLSGSLNPGLRLPATRLLAQELSVSRTTIVQAYDKLMSEGYLEGHVGSGTYVSGELPRELLAYGKHLQNRLTLPTGPAPRLSQRSQHFEQAVAKRGPYQVRAFEPNLPAFDAFPMALWSRIAAKQWRRSNGGNMAYGELAGYAPLRKAVARYLSTARGVKCEMEQIFITSGAHEAFTIAANLVADPGDRAWVESPGPFGVRNAVGAAGLDLVPVPVDDQGMMVHEGHGRAPDPSVIVVTPSRQHPLCVTMGLNRRLELLEAAERSKSWIIEDDYDSEFRYVGRPLPALQGLDTTGRVIYVGTFSKVLFPALRLGYVVVPPSLVDPFARAIAAFSRGAATPLQAIIANFIEEGHFTAHIRRMRKLYKERHDLLIEEAEKQLMGLLDVSPVQSGMHVMGWLPAGMTAVEVSQQAALAGVSAPPLSDYCLEPYKREGLLLGFTCVPPQEMAKNVGKLREVLEKCIARRSAC